MLHSKTIINRIGGGSIIINGKSFSLKGKSMEFLGDGQEYVDGVPLPDYEANYKEHTVMKIEITGSVQHIETEKADIQVNGNIMRGYYQRRGKQ